MLLHRYVAILAILFATAAPVTGRAAPVYQAAFLPGPDFAPNALNNAGQIAGFVNTPDGSSHAVLYSGGVLQDLGLPGDAFSYATAINAAGAVTGTFVLDGVAHGFVYQDGHLTDIGANTSGWGINARSDVVGSTSTDQGTYGFVYSGGTVTPLPNIGTGRQGVAADINDRGDVAGYSTTDIVSSPPPFHPYLYRGGNLQDLGDLGGRDVNLATAINNAGQIAGYSESRTDAHVFFYDGGVLKDLGSFGGPALSVNDLNEHGTLVGTALTADRDDVPFMNIGDALVDLNTLLDPAQGWHLFEAYANNDLGQIVGYGCQAETCGLVRLDLTTAVPEPGAIWLILPGTAILACVHRRRWRKAQPAAQQDARPRGFMAPVLLLALLSALLSALLAPLHGQSAALYAVAQLPQEFNPSDINNAGQMAGVVYSAAGGLHAAIYGGGVMTDLGTFGGAYSYATAINDAGAVTGNFGGTTGAEHAFLYRAGSIADLGSLNAVAINASGDVVGQQRDNGATGFLYSHGTLTELGHLGTGNVSLAAAINDAGQIVGESNLASDMQEPTHPYLYDGGTLVDLGTLAGRGVNSAVAINNTGQVAGYGDAGNGHMHAFFYEHGVMTDLGSFGGLDITIGGMNGLGQVVGTGNTPDGPDVAFISRDGALVDLNSLIDPASGWQITAALDINDRGQIVANACRTGQCSAVLLNLVGVVPEPRAVLMMLAGLTLLGRMSQRQT